MELLKCRDLKIIEKIENLRDCMHFDTKINFEQFYNFLNDGLGLTLELNEAKSLFNHLDDDCSGKITDHEVKSLLRLFSRVEYPV